MTSPATLEQHLGRVRRHAVLLLTCMTLGLLLGAGLVTLDERLVRARTSVLMSELQAYTRLAPNQTVPPSVTVDTDASLLRSDEVVDAVARETGVDASLVPDRLDVSATPLTRVLHVSFSAGDPETATAGADAAAQALLAARETTLPGARHASAAELLDSIAELRGQLPGENGSALAREQLRVQLDQLTDYLDGLVVDERRMGRVLTEARVVDPARTANPGVKLGGATMLGLLVGLAGARLLERRQAGQRPASS